MLRILSFESEQDKSSVSTHSCPLWWQFCPISRHELSLGLVTSEHAKWRKHHWTMLFFVSCRFSKRYSAFPSRFAKDTERVLYVKSASASISKERWTLICVGQCKCWLCCSCQIAYLDLNHCWLHCHYRVCKDHAMTDEHLPEQWTSSTAQCLSEGQPSAKSEYAWTRVPSEGEPVLPIVLFREKSESASWKTVSSLNAMAISMVPARAYESDVVKTAPDAQADWNWYNKKFTVNSDESNSVLLDVPLAPAETASLRLSGSSSMFSEVNFGEETPEKTPNCKPIPLSLNVFLSAQSWQDRGKLSFSSRLPEKSLVVVVVNSVSCVSKSVSSHKCPQKQLDFGTAFALKSDASEMTIRNEFELADKDFEKIASQMMGLWVCVKSTPLRQYHSRYSSFQAQSWSSPHWRSSSILKEILAHEEQQCQQKSFWVNSPSVGQGEHQTMRSWLNVITTTMAVCSLFRSRSLILKWMCTGQATTNFCTHSTRHLWKIWSKLCWNKAFLWTPRRFPVQQKVQRCFVDFCLWQQSFTGGSVPLRPFQWANRSPFHQNHSHISRCSFSIVRTFCMASNAWICSTTFIILQWDVLPKRGTKTTAVWPSAKSKHESMLFIPTWIIVSVSWAEKTMGRSLNMHEKYVWVEYHDRWHWMQSQ